LIKTEKQTILLTYLP